MICGIDEAGRGCIAGQMVVAGVVLNNPIEGLMDSKKLSEAKREALYEQIISNSEYKIVVFSAQDIDTLGISKCINQALTTIKEHFSDREILFDGNSTFGVEGITTMVKADTKIPEVSAASILAKVTRDRDINAFALQYPQYKFEKHKGYLTKAHKEALMEHGYTPIHRRSFKVKGMNV
ncbi:MAG: ribonuclease HII [Campylobacterota bacterium]|nr:ribonuclease HII [Campylobacterota bacterium]